MGPRHWPPPGLGVSVGQGLQLALGARAPSSGPGVAVRGLPSPPECCDRPSYTLRGEPPTFWRGVIAILFSKFRWDTKNI